MAQKVEAILFNLKKRAFVSMAGEKGKGPLSKPEKKKEALKDLAIGHGYPSSAGKRNRCRGETMYR